MVFFLSSLHVLYNINMLESLLRTSSIQFVLKNAIQSSTHKTFNNPVEIIKTTIS